jgi:undecaprenyl-diphosphatase
VIEANATAVIAWSLAALIVAALIVVIARRRFTPIAGTRAPAAHDHRLDPLPIALGASAAVFAVVAALVVAGDATGWDLSVLHLAARHQERVAIDLATVVTTLGALPVVLALLVVALAVLLWRHRPRQAAFVLAASLLAMAAGGLGKVAFDRPRPMVFSSGHDWSFLSGTSDWSFPSGHTVGATGLAAALVVVLWATRWRRPALVAALVVCAGVGVTRVYLGAHYPTDVIAGWALAVAAVGVARLAFGAPAER